MKPVAIVQHEAFVPAGLIHQVLAEQNVEHHIVEASKDPEWPATDDLGGLIVLGGTMNVDQLDEFPFLEQSRDLMAATIEAGVPTLGVCLGSQMMARVLGAEVHRADERNALFSPLDLTDEGRSDPLLAPFAGDVEVLQFHEDTFRFPESATPLATSRASGLGQAFRYGETAYAIQFHFEVNADIVWDWTQDIGEDRMVEQWNADDGGHSLHDQSRYEGQAIAGRQLIERFLGLCPTD